MTLGVDVGGTFTDVAWWDGDRLRVTKTSTTVDQGEGLVAGALAVLGERPQRPERLLHGTTVATNALLERRGAATALVTSEGFADVVEVGRQDRPALYDPAARRPRPLVPRSRRVTVAAHPDLPPPSRSGIEAMVERLAALRPEAVAVSLLYGYRMGVVEAELAEAIGRRLAGVPVSLSSEVVPEFREFERTSTTVLNAYLGPITGRYLERLSSRIVEAGLPAELLVMRSSGGLIDLADAVRLPAAVLLSGPAGGVVAAAAVGAALGHDRLISFDMGGTSTDVCRIEGGRPEVSYERPIDGYPCRLPSVAVHTVGAGGGSVGWVDPGGALRVGPRSAGAHPGPACYDRGGEEATVTDADLSLGRLAPSARLAGSVPVRSGPSERALVRLGEAAGLDAPATALGIVEIVEAHMERAVRAVSIEQGSDPRSAVLVAFGGAGGLHATALARRLDMAGVIIPPHAGVFSAVGLLLSPPRQDAARSMLITAGGAATLDEALAEVAAIAAAGLGGGAPEVRTIVDARYVGQSHETPVPYQPGEGWPVLAGRFHAAHAERNGFSRPEDPVEVVTVRAEAVGRPAMRREDLPDAVPEAGPARRGVRPVRVAGGTVDADVWWRPCLAPRDEIVGPAVIEETEATTYLAEGERAVVHPGGSMEVTW